MSHETHIDSHKQLEWLDSALRILLMAFVLMLVLIFMCIKAAGG